MEGPYCTGCSDLIDEGSVIAFGDSLFHLKCFICAKCSEQVDCDSNLLLLTNGRPVCESCSYCCNACRQVIRDEAIMTGDEAYHANCFRCVSCKKKIDDLVFTQTSKGIHCTPCYERRRTQKKRRREEREKRQLHKQFLSVKEPQNIPIQVPASSTSKQLKMKCKNNNSVTTHTNSNSKLLEKQVSKNGNNKNRFFGLDNHPKTIKINLIDPPTPSRSRSNSVEIPSKMRLNDNRPTPSRSEIIKTPSSPPSSITSVSPTPLSSQSTSSSRHAPPSLTKSTSTTSLHNSVSNQSIDSSFFENDTTTTTDISHVSNKMNSNGTLNNNDNDKKEIPEIVKTTENTTRASHYLEYSLVSDDYVDNISNSTESNVQMNEACIRTEPVSSNSGLETLQANYNKMKDASKKALQELIRVKEELSKEVSLRQQHEYMILQLQHQLQVVFQGRTMTRIELSVITKEEIERVARTKSELDKTCGELQSYRDALAKEIESLAKQKQAGLEINITSHLEEEQKAISAEIKSLTNDRDNLRTETSNLEKIKANALQDITTMGIKTSNKTHIDIEAARCFSEKELANSIATAGGGTSFLYSPSPSISSELQSPGLQRKSVDTAIVRKITARDIYNTNTPPKIFKLKHKGPGNMFAKLSGKSSTSSSSSSSSPSLSNKMDAISSLSSSSSSSATSSASAMYGGVSTSSMNLTGESKRDRFKQSHDGSGIQHGAHTFQHTSFLRPTKCDSCSEKMWGLSELRCNTCLYVTHGRCISNVPIICGGGRSNSSSSFDLSSTETEPSKSSLFGTDISARASTEERSIPVIVEQCINAVEKRGMDYEGIYRKSGGAAQIRLIHQAFDNGEPIDLEQDYPINDIGAITSVLKQYLRELPDPLLTYTLYPMFIDVISTIPYGERSSKFIEILSQLPKVNYDTLKLLLQHLHKVQERHTENLMTTKNVAMVFGPTLLRDVEATRDLIDMSSKNSVVEYLIIHVNGLFE